MSERPPGAPSDIADAGLAGAGSARIGWAQRSMPVLTGIGKVFVREKPLAGHTVAACLHVTAETAVLVQTLRAGGAQVYLAASNPLSTQDDIAAALDACGAAVVFARAGADRAAYTEHIHRALDAGPDLVVDDGGDLMEALHGERPDLLGKVLGGCESTTAAPQASSAAAMSSWVDSGFEAARNTRAPPACQARTRTAVSAVT